MGTLNNSPVVAWVTRQLTHLPETPPITPVRGFGITVFFAVLALLNGLGAALLNDPDSFWHIHIGQMIWTEHRFPTTDEWSHTVTGAPWIAKEWLSQVILALAQGLAGSSGVVLVSAAGIAGAFAVLGQAAANRMGASIAAILLVIVFALTAGHMLARPHAFAFLPMVAAGLILTRAAETARAPSLWLVPIVGVWANLHGSFLIVFVLGAALVVEAVARATPQRRHAVFVGWLVIGVLCALAPLAHPYGTGVYQAAFSVLGIEGIGHSIAEWKPEDFSTLTPMQVVLLGGFALIALEPTRLPIVRVLLLVLFAHLALTHVRHGAVFGFLGAVLLIGPIAAATVRSTRMNRGRGWVLAGAGCAGFALAVALVNMTIRPLSPPANTQPLAALEAVRQAGAKGAVFNEYGFGGYLIANGVPTYIDGRTELYGGERLARYLAAAEANSPAALDAILDDPRIGWTLLPPGLRAVGVLDRTPGWRRIHADAIAVVHVRDPAAKIARR